jgi:hypothetical protein
MWNPPDAASITDHKLDAYAEMDKVDDVQEKADKFIDSLVEAGERAWLGWLLYVLEYLDKESVVEDANGCPFFLSELFDEIDDRFVNGIW